MDGMVQREPSARGMGTMTGWHMLAMDVMENGLDDAPGEDDDDEKVILKPTYNDPPSPSSPLQGLMDPPSPSFTNKQLNRVIKAGGSVTAKGKAQGEATTAGAGSGAAAASAQLPREDSPRSMITPVAKATSSFHNEYQVVEEIGAGAFGRAMKARRMEDGELVVAKEVKLGLMSEKERYITKNEVNVLANLDHPNIVKYHDCYADNIMLHIVMEFCGGGDLSGYLKKRGGELLPEDEIMLKFVQVCLAMQYVHRQGILHRDLKGSNIFLTEDGIIKLGDFGISKVLNDHGAFFSMAQSVVGTPNYMAPEICKSRPYGLKSDIWALGCVLYELCMHKPAFDGNNLPAVVIKILSAQYKAIPDVYSDDLNRLIKKLLSKNPKHRPTLDEILGYDYVRYHLQQFGAHIERHVYHRKASLKRSLNHLNISYTASAAPIPSSSLDTPSSAASGSSATPFRSRLRNSSFLDGGSPSSQQDSPGEAFNLSRERTSSDPGGLSAMPSADSFSNPQQPDLSRKPSANGNNSTPLPPPMQMARPSTSSAHGGATTIGRQSSGLYRPYTPQHQAGPAAHSILRGSSVPRPAVPSVGRVPRITEGGHSSDGPPIKIRRSHSDSELQDLGNLPQIALDSCVADMRRTAEARRATRDTSLDGQQSLQQPPPDSSSAAAEEGAPLSMSQIFKNLLNNGLASAATEADDELPAPPPPEAQASMLQQLKDEQDAAVQKLVALKRKLGITTHRVEMDLIPDVDGGFRWHISSDSSNYSTSPSSSSSKPAPMVQMDFRYALASASSDTLAEAATGPEAGRKARGTLDSVLTRSTMTDDDDGVVLDLQKRLDEKTDDSNDASEADRDTPTTPQPRQGHRYDGMHHDWDPQSAAI